MLWDGALGYRCTDQAWEGCRMAAGRWARGDAIRGVLEEVTE